MEAGVQLLQFQSGFRSRIGVRDDVPSVGMTEEGIPSFFSFHFEFASLDLQAKRDSCHTTSMSPAISQILLDKVQIL